MIDPAATHPLLRELNDALAIEGAEPVDWIVCGGTALGILGLVQRPTRDVDVISGWSSATLQIVQIDRFPPAVERAIVRVADAHPEGTRAELRHRLGDQDPRPQPPTPRRAARVPAGAWP